MQVIPVVDILNGTAVHALRGQRNEYKPLKSNIAPSANPLDVAIAFKHLGFSRLYIADLDAIIACTTDFPTVLKIAAQTGLQLIVDAGVTSLERGQHLLDSGAARLVLGTETLQSLQFVKEAVERFGVEKVVISLDLKSGKLLARDGFAGPTDPVALLKEFESFGIKEVIILDLARVGSGEGVDITLLKRAISDVYVDVYVGGGVRNITDLTKLNELGVKGALVATALHNGQISIGELKKEGFL